MKLSKLFRKGNKKGDDFNANNLAVLIFVLAMTLLFLYLYFGTNTFNALK